MPDLGATLKRPSSGLAIVVDVDGGVVVVPGRTVVVVVVGAAVVVGATTGSFTVTEPVTAAAAVGVWR